MNKNVWQIIQSISYDQSILEIAKSTLTCVFDKYLHAGDFYNRNDGQFSQVCRNCGYEVHFRSVLLNQSHRNSIVVFYNTHLIITSPNEPIVGANYKINDSWVGDVNVTNDRYLSPCPKFAAFT